MSKVLGRNNEVSKLQRCMESDRAELILVCGRRRVGKTYLVEKFFSQKYAFCFVGGHNLPQDIQLRNFKKALLQYGKFGAALQINSWYDAFDALEVLIAKNRSRKKVIFFDEMPWIDNPKSMFVSALENFWNSFAARRNDIVFVASGSATSWMNDKIINNQGGLHNRVTLQLFLKPFPLKDTEDYLRSRNITWDRYQIIQMYMITGGVPFYLSLLDASLSLVQNVDRLFFSEDGQLKAEFRELYPALFKNADNYIAVVRALNEKKTGLTRNDIAKATKIQGGTLTKILNNLELCDFIKVFSHYGRNTKNSVYRLTDFYTLFYFRFLEHNKTNDPEFWQHNFTRQSISVWQGFSFENVCLTHISQIKEALKIAGIGTEVSTWRDDYSQIDLIIKRADHTVNLCEIKFSNGPYVVDADYADRIRSRQAHFASVTRTTYGITNTFITVYGVANGKNSSVVQSEVKATDLFAF